MKKWMLICSLTVVFAGLAGCGDDDDGATDTGLTIVDGGVRLDGARVDSSTQQVDASTGGKAVGEPCTGNTECAGGLCVTQLPGGYCTQDCMADGMCPLGSECFELGGQVSVCLKTCTVATECREAEGYTCDTDMTCFPI